MELANSVASVVDKARTSWLKNHEVLELLEGYSAAGLTVCQEPPQRPAGGQLFLFDRRICRYFRRDGHNWRKKPDNKTIRETHEKLKVGNAETLNCYYAHADQDDGLQRRCYWQLDPERDHIVLVHYLCCASSRAGAGGAARAASSELVDPGVRPQRAARAAPRRAYSPGAGRRRGGAVSLGAATSLDSELGSQASGEGELALPLPGGMTLAAAAALPSLAAQYAMQQGVLLPPPHAQQGVLLPPPHAQQGALPPPPHAQQGALPPPHAQQGALPPPPHAQQAAPLPAASQQSSAPPPAQLPPMALSLPPMALTSRGSGGSTSGDLDMFGLPILAGHQRPHPGVLYTDPRVAAQLSAAAHQQAAAPGHGAPLPPRPLWTQGSFAHDADRPLFREMSLGIQREAAEDAAYFLSSPGSGEVPDPASANVSPNSDLAALLASPPHGGHRRSFSRQGSGLSRLISKNWESDVMELMLPDVDADLTAYPVGGGGDADRPGSPSSRLFGAAGIAFFGSAAGSGSGGGSSGDNSGGAAPAEAAAAEGGALEPSPLGPAGLAPAAGSTGGTPQRHLPFASPLQPAPGDSPGDASLQFAPGEGRAARPRLARLSGAAAMPRTGSHPHLAHLAKRPGGTPEAATEEERRKGRVDAAASAAACAAQEHRDEKLAAARGLRTVHSGEGEDALEMIDVPENLQRLSSFLNRGPGGPPAGRPLAPRELLAAAEGSSAQDLEFTRSLLKHMSIDEVDAVAAVRDAAKELQVLPTIHAAHSSELEVLSGAPSVAGRDSLSEELGSRVHSVSSLEGGGPSAGAPGGLAAGGGSLPLDPISEQLQAAMARHASRSAR